MSHSAAIKLPAPVPGAVAETALARCEGAIVALRKCENGDEKIFAREYKRNTNGIERQINDVMFAGGVAPSAARRKEQSFQRYIGGAMAQHSAQHSADSRPWFARNAVRAKQRFAKTALPVLEAQAARLREAPQIADTARFFQPGAAPQENTPHAMGWRILEHGPIGPDDQPDDDDIMDPCEINPREAAVLVGTIGLITVGAALSQDRASPPQSGSAAALFSAALFMPEMSLDMGWPYLETARTSAALAPTPSMGPTVAGNATVLPTATITPPPTVLATRAMPPAAALAPSLPMQIPQPVPSSNLTQLVPVALTLMILPYALLRRWAWRQKPARLSSTHRRLYD